MQTELKRQGYVERKGDDNWVMSLVEGIAPVGKPEKDWPNTVSADIRLLGVESHGHPGPYKLEAMACVR